MYRPIKAKSDYQCVFALRRYKKSYLMAPALAAVITEFVL